MNYGLITLPGNNNLRYDTCLSDVTSVGRFDNGCIREKSGLGAISEKKST